MNHHPPYPPQPHPHAGYPQPSFPPYAYAAPPPRKSRLGLWLLLGFVGLVVAMFGACGALIAFLPDAPASASSTPKPEANEGNPARKVAALRQDVPVGAAQTMKKAQDAIRARDFDALRATLEDGSTASYMIDGNLEAKNPRTAVEAWKKNPEMLKRIDAALSAKCEVDPPDEGHILVSCGKDSSGSLYVILTNMVDGQSKHVFRIYAVGQVL